MVYSQTNPDLTGQENYRQLLGLHCIWQERDSVSLVSVLTLTINNLKLSAGAILEISRRVRAIPHSITVDTFF